MMVSGCPIRAKFQDLGSLETRKYQKNLKVGLRQSFVLNKTFVISAKIYKETDIKVFLSLFI